MDLHFIAQWLDSACRPFDHAILEFMHALAQGAGAILTPIAQALALIGDNGYLCFLTALILLFFPKTRKAGFCIIGAVLIGAVMTNLTLKESVLRLRPYASGNPEFESWWRFIGAPAESEFSFPSGHTTAAAAGAVALCLSFKKLYVILPAIAYAIVMGLSRNYLMVHYPTDVLAGLAVGSVAAVAAFFIAKGAYRFMENRRRVKLFAFVLDFDPIALIRKNKSKEPENDA